MEDLDVGGKIILKLIFYKWEGSMDWTDLVQYRDGWNDLENAVVNPRGYKMRRI